MHDFDGISWALGPHGHTGENRHVEGDQKLPSAIHFPDHHVDVDELDDEEEDREAPLAWNVDNVQLVTVGVDIGSSTSHLLFARLHLQRLSQQLSSRFAVMKREVLYRSSVLLTPYRADGLIDVDALERFVDQAYDLAGLDAAAIDTGAVILTGAALERANARAVADLFAREGGKFVCASAGHNLEAILSAHGSGATALSHRRGDTLLHIDIGGGTSKLSLLRDGDVLETAAVQVGGRLVAEDADGLVVRIEPAAEVVARQAGVDLAFGRPLTAEDRARLCSMLAAVLVDAAGGPPRTPLARELMLTPPLHFEDAPRPSAVSFSGGVAEYIYGREGTRYGDLGGDLAAAVVEQHRSGTLPRELVSTGEGIRATVIGASQFTVQLSGNTLHITNPGVLPVRNLPVVQPRLPASDFDTETVRKAIAEAFRRLDLTEGDQTVALAIPWRGDPEYATLRALAGGIVSAMPRSIEAGLPLVVALHEDVGRALGSILEEDFGVAADMVSIDGLQLMELDYIDVGEIIHPAEVVPVVVKSLAFPVPHGPASTGVHSTAALLR